MGFYYSILFGAILIGVLCKATGDRPQKQTVYIAVAFVVLAGISALRYDVGFDYSYVYAPQYTDYLYTPDYSLAASRFELGFQLLERIIAFFFRDFQMFFVVTSVLIVGLITLYYRLFSPSVYISVFLFLTLSHFYCTMNFVRQSLAGAIALFALPFLKRKQFHFYLPVVLLAASFHKSALLLIPFFFVNLLPVTNKYVLIGFCATTLLLYRNTERILTLITQYWYQSYTPGSEHVTTFFDYKFALAPLVIFLLLLLGHKQLTARDKGNYVYVNYAFFAFFFALMGTKHSILDRFSIYFAFAAPVALAILLDELWTADGQPLGSKGLRARNKHAILAAAATVLIFAGALSIHHFALVMDHHGVSPYRLITEQPFYHEYREWLNL